MHKIAHTCGCGCMCVSVCECVCVCARVHAHVGVMYVCDCRCWQKPEVRSGVTCGCLELNLDLLQDPQVFFYTESSPQPEQVSFYDITYWIFPSALI